MMRPLITAIRAGVLTACLLFAGGCVLHDPPRPASPAAALVPPAATSTSPPIADDQWPRRRSAPVARLEQDLRHNDVPIVSVLLPSDERGTLPVTFVRDAEQLEHVTRTGTGIVVGTRGDPADIEVNANLMLQFVSYDPILDPEPRRRQNARRRFIDLSGGHRAVLHEPDHQPRGLIILFQGLGGHTYIRRVVRDLVDNDWAVLEADFPLLFKHEYIIHVDADGIERGGEHAARCIDTHLAEHAFAAEAMLDTLERRRPDLTRGPVCLVGFSGGAMLLPAVAARLHERVDAAVLALGGANIMRVGADSALTAGAMRFDWARPPTDDDRSTLIDAYLNSSSFDPHHLAPSMRHMPVLMIQATDDRIVPTHTQQTLYERLGKPERWRILGGHRFAFFLMPSRGDDIARWLERNTSVGGSLELLE